MKSAPHFLRSQFSFISCVLAVFLAALSSSGCMTTKAATAAKEPLVVPPAPPRVIAPAPEPEDQAVPSGEPEPVPQLPRQTRTAPRDNAPRSEPKPPQQGMPGPTEAEAKPPVAPPPVAPAPELRTIDTTDDAKATRQVRDTMERAGRTLAQIDYGRLAKASQLQYDMAKRFIEQSEEALKNKNFTAAQLMAEKAETIAKELSGR
jgi:hypothetical protein